LGKAYTYLSNGPLRLFLERHPGGTGKSKS